MDIINSDLELIYLSDTLLTDKPTSDHNTLSEEMPILLDTGEETITQNQLTQVVHALSREECAFLGRGANSVCYKIAIAGKETEDGEIILKKAALNKGRTNADMTFAEEARQLATLSRIGIPNMPSLVGRFKYRGNYYLLSRFVPGSHPDALLNPFQPIHLDRLFKILFLMDRSGFVHYDLQASNILLTEEDVGFIDFEFAEQINLLATYHPKQQEL
jgi:predicted Ser/Thr protein kinase